MRASRDDSTNVMIFSGAFPRTRPQRRTDDRLAERRAELARLDAAIAGLRAEGPKVVEIVGIPGIGKARLPAALSARAERAGQLVLAGRASELERETPFEVVVKGSMATSPRSSRDGSNGSALTCSSSSLRPSPVSPTSPCAPRSSGTGCISRCGRCSPRSRCHRGSCFASTTCTAVTRRRSSRSHSCCALRPRVPALLLLAYRPRQTRTLLSAVLAAAGDGRHVERLEVGPSSAEEPGEPLGELRALPETGRLVVGDPFWPELVAAAAAVGWPLAALRLLPESGGGSPCRGGGGPLGRGDGG